MCRRPSTHTGARGRETCHLLAISPDDGFSRYHHLPSHRNGRSTATNIAVTPSTRYGRELKGARVQQDCRSSCPRGLGDSGRHLAALSWPSGQKRARRRWGGAVAQQQPHKGRHCSPDTRCLQNKGIQQTSTRPSAKARRSHILSNTAKAPVIRPNRSVSSAAKCAARIPSRGALT